MTEDEKTELLIRLEGKVDTLCTAWEKVSNGDGFTRCAKRGEQLITLFKFKDKTEQSHVWQQRALYSALVAAFITALVSTVLANGV